MQDVTVLFGLPVEGRPLVGNDSTKTKEEWQNICQELLGFRPLKLYGGRLAISALNNHMKTFGAINDDTDVLVVRQLARCYMMMMIGGALFSDKSGNKVKLMYLTQLEDIDQIGTYSWGSAVLACLYRGLCRASLSKVKNICGFLPLLQVWAWERLKMVHPTRCQPRVDAINFSNELPNPPYASRWNVQLSWTRSSQYVLPLFRDQLDSLVDEQFVWEPYTADVMENLADYCRSGQDFWKSVVPLLCWDVAEMHQPNRVLRQFGMRQHIPSSCHFDKEHEKTDRRGRPDTDWTIYHANQIVMWNDFANRVWIGPLAEGSLPYDDKYLTWYRSITRPIIGNPEYRIPKGYASLAPISEAMARQLHMLHQYGIELKQQPTAKVAGMTIMQMCIDGLTMAHEAQRLDVKPSYVPFEQPEVGNSRTSGRRGGAKGRGKGRSKTTTTDVPESSSTKDANPDCVSPMDDVNPDLERGCGSNVASGSRQIVIYNAQPFQQFPSDGFNNDDDVYASPPRAEQTGPSIPTSQTPISWPIDGTLTLGWVTNLMLTFDWASRNLSPSEFPSVLPVEDFDCLVLTASKILHKEPNCLQINSGSGLGPNSKVVVVGDVHGQLHDVLFLLSDAGFPSQDQFYVFNGDYVDRGAWGLETFLLLLAWKVLMPNRVFLLRGNHESKKCTSVYGFEKEVSMKYADKGTHVYRKCLGCFKELPLASIIGGNVYTAHGGIFRSTSGMQFKKANGKKRRKLVLNPDVSNLSIGSLEELLEARRFVLDPPFEGPNVIPGDVMWSDPSKELGLKANDQRGIGLLWGSDCTENFLQKFKLKLIIRSHEGPDAREKRHGLDNMNNGYSIDHEGASGKLITLYSAPDYPQSQFQASPYRHRNKGAYIVLESPNFDIPAVHSFEAVTRPEVYPYYDYEISSTLTRS